MDMGKNHHTPTYLHLPTIHLNNLPISTLPPRLWTMDIKERFVNFNLVDLLGSLVGFRLSAAAVSHAASFVLYDDKIDSLFIIISPDDTFFFYRWFVLPILWF